ncbi:BatA domain-containing protein [Hoyosella rhizosphaerae]|nr:BatA domain-containing protein [Hoyosella rhizosphaerae]MBN4925920.1 BatA domain-containing protein [Hoyosella rhizosphaerae]
MTQPQHPQTPTPEQRGPRKRKKWPWIVGALVVILLIFAIASPSPEDGDTPSAGAEEEPSEITPETEDSAALPELEVIFEPDPIVISGVGQTATDSFLIEGGATKFTMSHDGASNFQAIVLDFATGDRAGSSLVNEIGTFRGSTIRHLPAGEFVIDVRADGPWELLIEQPRPTDGPVGGSFSGQGMEAVGPIRVSGGLTRVELSHDGSSNFQVSFIDSQGNRAGRSLVNEIGAFSGSTTASLGAGLYWLDVNADGPWTINLS